MVIVEFNVVPLGVGVSVSKFLVPALKELKKQGIKHEITSMCTIFEAKNAEEAFKIIRAAHKEKRKTIQERICSVIIY